LRSVNLGYMTESMINTIIKLLTVTMLYRAHVYRHSRAFRRAVHRARRYKASYFYQFNAPCKTITLERCAGYLVDCGGRVARRQR